MASARRTYDTDSITLRTVFAKNPDNTNVPALRTLTADGAGGSYWAIPSTLGIIPAFNEIQTDAGTYTADLSYNTFRLTSGEGIGMVNGPVGSNQTILYAKAFNQFDVSGNNSLQAFTTTLNATVNFAGQGGIQITADPATNTMIFNGSAVIANVSTGIYGFNQLKVTPVTSTITSTITEFGGDYITATSPSSLLRFAGVNDIQLSTNVTTNSVFFTISTFTSKGYLDISANAYAAYPSTLSTVSSLYVQIPVFNSTIQYLSSTNGFNFSSVVSSINALAMSTGDQFYLLTGLINAKVDLIQYLAGIAGVNSNIQSTSVGLGTLGYLSSCDTCGGVTDIQLISTFNQSPNLTNIALGYEAGITSQQANAIAIGVAAGSNNQGDSAIAIGNAPAYDNQGQYGIAIGTLSGYSNQGESAIAIGNRAGQYYQSSYSIAIGNLAGNSNQQSNAIAVGYNAGLSNQGSNAISLGTSAGFNSQTDYSIAIGFEAGYSNQMDAAIALGYQAGYSNQASYAIAIGNGAGSNAQGNGSIGIGLGAASNNQGTQSIAFGNYAGASNQNSFALAVGGGAGLSNQGYYTTALGFAAGEYSQGDYSVAIGYGAGQNNQSPSSIVISALASTIEAPNAGLYMAPIRDITSVSPLFLSYNTSAFEIGTTEIGSISSINVSSIKDPISSITVNVNALWSTLYNLYPVCFA